MLEARLRHSRWLGSAASRMWVAVGLGRLVPGSLEVVVGPDRLVPSCEIIAGCDGLVVLRRRIAGSGEEPWLTSFSGHAVAEDIETKGRLGRRRVSGAIVTLDESVSRSHEVVINLVGHVISSRAAIVGRNRFTALFRRGIVGRC